MAERYLVGCLPVADDDLLKPSEAARLAGVGITTLRNRERAGTIPADAVTRTPAGHRRYRAGVIIALLEEARQ